MDEQEALAYLILEDVMNETMRWLDDRSVARSNEGDWLRVSIYAQLRAGLVKGVMDMKQQLAITQLEQESQGTVDD
jgi:hypothetical protein